MHLHLSPTRQRSRPLTAQFLDALLAGHGLPRTLARARVGLGSLPAHRQAPLVAHAPVALDVTQARDVLLHLAAKGPFDRIFTVQNPGQPADLIVRQFLSAPLR